MSAARAFNLALRTQSVRALPRFAGRVAPIARNIRPATIAALPARRLYSTSPEDPILVEKHGPKAVITLNRPRTGNSLDPDLQANLEKILKELEADLEVRAIVLTGNGRFFCTGMNLSAKGEGTKGNNEEQFSRASAMFKAVENLEKPVIAVINGSCYGGGNGLAMACDVRIVAKPDITFTLSEVKIGFIPAIISRYIVREWGVAKSREAMITARSVPAQELHQVGAVHYIEENIEAAHKRADEVVAQIQLGAPRAIGDVKQLILSAATEPAESHWATIQKFFIAMMVPNEEGRHGLAAFQAKKKPDWTVLKGAR